MTTNRNLQQQQPMFRSALPEISIEPPHFDSGNRFHNDKGSNNDFAASSTAAIGVLTHHARDVNDMDLSVPDITTATHSILMDTASHSGSIHYPSLLDSLPTVEEADYYQGMSHLCLDGLASFGDPTMIGVRLAVFMGYMFSLLADWIPDHSVDDPTECALNVIMLYCALSSFCESFVHEAATLFASSVPHRDMRAFKLLFEPSGLSFRQCMYLSEVIDWLDLAEGSR
mmetsp:Transcript_12218/g.26955  ORF Transcript_12218/g.26955 Transcript_12218/m.26955 type:complete len:228 (+) Transcript_12218:225-908(+)